MFTPSVSVPEKLGKGCVPRTMSELAGRETPRVYQGTEVEIPSDLLRTHHTFKAAQTWSVGVLGH